MKITAIKLIFNQLSRATKLHIGSRKRQEIMERDIIGIKLVDKKNIIKKRQKGRFEGLQKKYSNMPRVVWAEESKTGLEFEIRPRQKNDSVSPVCNGWPIQLYVYT